MPTISIILAAYNAEAKIRTMLDSIIAQTFIDWELIAVDDGSTDRTGNILDEYAATDHRVRVIHKVNAGVAAARQDGIDAARGEYTIHADADDWVEPQMLNEMFKAAQRDNADILIADYYINAGGKTDVSRQEPESTSAKDVLLDLYSKKILGSLWNKLIRKSTYEKAQARFYDGINYCEDLLLLTQLLTRSQPVISYLPAPFYHYVLNSGSLTQAVTLNGLESMKRFHREAAALLPAGEQFRGISESFEKHEFTVFFMNHLYSGKKELRKEYRRLKPLLTATSGFRWRLGYKCIEFGLVSLAHRLIKF